MWGRRKKNEEQLWVREMRDFMKSAPLCLLDIPSSRNIAYCPNPLNYSKFFFTFTRIYVRGHTRMHRQCTWQFAREKRRTFPPNWALYRKYTKRTKYVRHLSSCSMYACSAYIGTDLTELSLYNVWCMVTFSCTNQKGIYLCIAIDEQWTQCRWVTVPPQPLLQRRRGKCFLNPLVALTLLPLLGQCYLSSNNNSEISIRTHGPTSKVGTS